MKIVFSLSTVALIAMSSLVSTTYTAAAAGAHRIKTAAEFNKLVVGKVLTQPNNHITIDADGTFEGNYGGAHVAGTWKWRGKFWCRHLTAPKDNKECQVWIVDGNNFKVIREKGKGEASIYTTK